MAIEGLVFDETFNKLEKALSETARRQGIIAYNIANANTPGFKPLSFDEELNKAEKKLQTSPKGVVIEEEMAKLADNTLRYTSYIRLLTNKIAIIRRVVSQGRQ